MNVLLFCISVGSQIVSILAGIFVFLRALREHRKLMLRVNNGIAELTRAVAEAAVSATLAASAAAAAIKQRDQSSNE